MKSPVFLGMCKSESRLCWKQARASFLVQFRAILPSDQESLSCAAIRGVITACAATTEELRPLAFTELVSKNED